MKINKKIIASFVAISLFALTLSSHVVADEIVISGNGSDSNSQVSIQNNTATNIEQYNNADISNDIQVNSDTGNNDISENSDGDIEITTGDVKTNILIGNSVNSTESDLGCCSGTTNVNITGNGSDSQNSVDMQYDNQLDVRISNSAVIENSISGRSNTGDNETSGNTSGAISIKTGNISARLSILNDPINEDSLDLLIGKRGIKNFNITGNGSGSLNRFTGAFNDENDNIYTNFSADIENYILWSLNTGGNNASDNVDGGAEIDTGDIDFELILENISNIGKIDMDCCEEKEVKDEDKAGDGDEIGDNGGQDGDKKVEKGKLLPLAAAVEAGGPGIIGLSDTSSERANSLIFLVGLILVTFGVSIMGEAKLGNLLSDGK